MHEPKLPGAAIRAIKSQQEEPRLREFRVREFRAIADHFDEHGQPERAESFRALARAEEQKGRAPS